MRYLKTFLIVFLIVFFLLGGFRVAMLLISEPLIKSYEDIQAMPVVMVPGAGLLRDGTPSSPLRDRLDAAAQLYRDGKVQKSCLQVITACKLQRTRRDAELSYPDRHTEEDLVLDYAGRRTYDSCYRAKAIFGLDEYHHRHPTLSSSQSIFLCDKLGLETQDCPLSSPNTYEVVSCFGIFGNLRHFGSLLGYLHQQTTSSFRRARTNLQ